MTEYLVGLLVATSVAACGAWVGLDRDRAFYPTALIVIAFYYVLFGAMSGSMRVLGIETVVALAFTVAALIGFKRSMGLVAAGIAGHGVFDFVHHWFITNPGIPVWWPGFCGTVDVALGAWLGYRLWQKPDRIPTA